MEVAGGGAVVAECGASPFHGLGQRGGAREVVAVGWFVHRGDDVRTYTQA